MLLVGAVIILVGGFIVVSPGSDDADKSAASATTPIATTNAPAPTPAPTATIVVQAGKPVGAIKTIKARKDDHVTIVVSSPDTTSEVHFHGYDIKRDLEAGDEVTFTFTAELEGIFEMELEGTAVQIAKIEISPS